LLGATAEALRANIDLKSAISLQRGLVDPKFQVEGVAPANHSSKKTRLSNLSYRIKIYTDISSVLSQSMRLTDGQTDRQTVARPRLHSMRKETQTMFRYSLW